MYPPAEFNCDSLMSSPTPTPATLETSSSPTISSKPTLTLTPTMKPSSSSRPSMAPSNTCPPPYDSSFNYAAGAQVNFGEEVFICQPQDGSDQCTDDSSVWSHVKACCPPAFDFNRTDYQAYDKVSYEGMVFMCQPDPYEEYCNIYEEDSEWNYTQYELYLNAWTHVGDC